MSPSYSGESPPVWVDWVSSQTAHTSLRPAMWWRSVAAERNLPPPGGRPDVGEINYRLRSCCTLGAHIACGLRNIHLRTHKYTQAQSPSAPCRQDPSACWIPDEHQHPPALPEVLLLCLQVAQPGTQPTASRFHVAKGIILPFVCVGVYGLH